MSEVTLSLIQMSCSENQKENLEKAKSMVRRAAENGANIVVLPELFMGRYFCQEYNAKYFDLSEEYETSGLLESFAEIAREYKIVLPISFFEKRNNVFYNSVAFIDEEGYKRGLYRKIHIPDDPGYYEKYYFTPGDLGIKVWKTSYGVIGVGICWDQWYPEMARIMALMGAEIIIYPTAIGYHTNQMTPDCSKHWGLTMRGHAAANMVPIAAVNRVGVEKGIQTEINFFGSSFITDGKGETLAAGSRSDEGTITATLDLTRYAKNRKEFVLYRDRRPECYHRILSKDGQNIPCECQINLSSES